MDSFEKFWDEIATPQIDCILPEIVDKGKDAESTAEVLAFALIKCSKTLLASYHAWLLQNLEQK